MKKIKFLLAIIISVLCLQSCFNASQNLIWSDDQDNVHIQGSLVISTDGDADASLNLTGETGRRLDGRISFDGEKIADIDTLPWQFHNSWSGLSSDLHTIKLEWIGEDGTAIDIPFSFKWKKSVSISR